MTHPRSHSSPLSRYEYDLTTEGFVKDEAQYNAVAHLQDVYERVIGKYEARLGRFGRLSRFAHKWFGHKRQPEVGLYLWGGVGRGKTYLMDVFFDALPFEQKMRTHFHRFMRLVHAELTVFKGQKDPLDLVAKKIASQAHVICFDEFFVKDITDAMILSNLLRALFQHGVTLVATSNIPPKDLYKDGLQRERFMPAIELVQRHTQIINVDGGVDYRLRALRQADLYHSPLGAHASEEMSACFKRLVPDALSIVEDEGLEIEGRIIKAKFSADDVVWFDFLAICDGPRSQNDYIELACEYHAVLISDIPELSERLDDVTRRFIYLVDEFYDRRVKLILSAARPIHELYVGDKLTFEFERTISRIIEMQSEEYLQVAHKA